MLCLLACTAVKYGAMESSEAPVAAPVVANGTSYDHVVRYGGEPYEVIQFMDQWLGAKQDGPVFGVDAKVRQLRELIPAADLDDVQLHQLLKDASYASKWPPVCCALLARCAAVTPSAPIGRGAVDIVWTLGTQSINVAFLFLDQLGAREIRSCLLWISDDTRS